MVQARGTGPDPAVHRSLWPAGTLLAALDADDRAALLGVGHPRRYRPGEFLIVEGGSDREVLVLLRGYAKVLGSSPEGTVVLLSIRVGGDVVGELAALDGEPRSASVLAVTDVDAQVVGHRTFEDFLAARPRAEQAVRRSMAGKLRSATQRRVDTGGAPVITRLARVLEYLATHHGERIPDGVRIAIPLSQPDLAALIGAAEPSLQRAVALLRREGVLRTGYRALVILDRAGLARFAS